MSRILSYFFFLFFIGSTFQNNLVHSMSPDEEKEVVSSSPPHGTYIEVDSFFKWTDNIYAFLKKSSYRYEVAEIPFPTLTLIFSENDHIHLGPLGGSIYLPMTDPHLPLSITGNLHSTITLRPSGDEIAFSFPVEGKLFVFQNSILMTQLQWNQESMTYRLIEKNKSCLQRRWSL